MDNRPLKVKALECAIADLMTARSRDQGNTIFKKWEVFKNDPMFLKAITKMQEKLSTKQNAN